MSLTFIQELQGFVDPKPKNFDPEDDSGDETRARLVDKTFENGEMTGSNARTESTRKSIGPRILALEDEKYRGKVTKRRRLSSNAGEIFEDGDQSEMDDFGDHSESNSESSSMTDEDEQGDGNLDEIFSDQSEPEKIGQKKQHAKDGTDMSVGNLKNFAKVDLQEEYAKARAVQAQLKLWEQLLAFRIKLQRLLALANRLPQSEASWKTVLQEAFSLSSTPSSLSDVSSSCRRSLKLTLDFLLNSQNSLFSSNELTKVLCDAFDQSTSSKRKNADGSTAAPSFDDLDDDEEILSSPDEKEDDEEEKNGGKMRQKRNGGKSYKAVEYPAILAKRHALFKRYRDKILTQWHEKTRLASGKVGGRNDFAAFEKNIVKQIEQILADKSRLLNRTQLKRSDYEIFGKNVAKSMEVTKNDADQLEDDEDHDEEIFDDDDFYHQLLREIIERKAVGVMDPHTLGRQWLEIQKIRSKAKKKLVDRKASKARKIRYDLLPKLVNFMAPVTKNSLAVESRQELFKSLFGNSTCV